MNKKTLTCIVCPMGCQIQIEADKGSIGHISGNACRRGADYAAAEILHPARTLTSTIKVREGKKKLVPVKSDKPLPKDLLKKCMEIINECTAAAPINIGDRIVDNILDTGVHIIATFPVERDGQ